MVYEGSHSHQGKITAFVSYFSVLLSPFHAAAYWWCISSTTSDDVRSSTDTEAVRHELNKFTDKTVVAMIRFCVEVFINRSNAKGKSLLSIFDILRGREKFKYDSKDLYDHRICYYEKSTSLIRPVNRWAEIALQKMLSTFASAELPIMTYGMLADS
jgi:hypothetical protein